MKTTLYTDPSAIFYTAHGDHEVRFNTSISQLWLQGHHYKTYTYLGGEVSFIFVCFIAREVKDKAN